MNQSARANDTLVVFRSAQQKWALPISAVKRVVQAAAISPCPGAPPQVLGLINLHGSILPVFNFRRCLGLPERPLESGDCFVIVETPPRRVALVADEVCDILEGDGAAPLRDRAWPAELAGFAGVLQVQGDLVLIYDLERLLSRDEAHQLSAALAPV